MPGRHHHEAKNNEDASQPDAECDNQEKPEAHPMQGDGAEEDHECRWTGDDSTGYPEGQQGPAGDGLAHAGLVLQDHMSRGLGMPHGPMGVGSTLGVGMGVRVAATVGMTMRV